MRQERASPRSGYPVCDREAVVSSQHHRASRFEYSIKKAVHLRSGQAEKRTKTLYTIFLESFVYLLGLRVHGIKKQRSTTTTALAYLQLPDRCDGDRTVKSALFWLTYVRRSSRLTSLGLNLLGIVSRYMSVMCQYSTPAKLTSILLTEGLGSGDFSINVPISFHYFLPRLAFGCPCLAAPRLVGSPPTAHTNHFAPRFAPSAHSFDWPAMNTRLLEQRRMRPSGCNAVDLF